MSSGDNKVEESAIRILKRAVELDTKKKFTEALVCYQEGIELLMMVMKDEYNQTKKEQYRTRIGEYMARAEKVKAYVETEKEAGRYHEQIQIVNGSTGYSYEHLFSRFLDQRLSEVVVEDPYIRNTHQIYNFLRFCELLVASKCSIQKISLLTGRDEKDRNLQDMRFQEIKKSLSEHNIELTVDYSDCLHDREIRFNNGWVVKIGRGLDYFRACGKFSIGFTNLELRKCHETTVDIFHLKHTKSS